MKPNDEERRREVPETEHSPVGGQETPAASADVQLFSRYAKAWLRVKQKKADLATAELEASTLEVQVRERMMGAGVQSVRVDGVTLYVHRQLWARNASHEGEPTDVAYHRACAALQEAGLGDLVHERYNVQTLSAFFREEARDREWDDVADLLPEELRGAIELTEDYRVRARQS